MDYFIVRADISQRITAYAGFLKYVKSKTGRWELHLPVLLISSTIGLSRLGIKKLIFDARQRLWNP
jgi:hypothetical protein